MLSGDGRILDLRYLVPRSLPPTCATIFFMRWLPGIVLVVCALAADWPQFRGPGGQGHSTETGLPLTWSEKENATWKVALPGKGWSSPAIQGGRIWMTTATENGRSLRVLVADAATGRVLHDVEVLRDEQPQAIHAKNSHATPTPVLAGETVYVHFGAAGTAAVRASDASVIWKTQLPYKHGHGSAGSPVLFEDLLIFNGDGTDQQFVAALDTATGKLRWKAERRTAMAFSTPLIIEVDGEPQLVSTGAFLTAAYEPRTGKEIWRVRYGEGFSNVPRPVFGHGLVFLCTGFYGPNLLAVRPTGRGDVTATHIAWQTNRNVPHTPSALIVGDEIYMVSDNGIATSLDVRSGTRHWQERLGGNHSASPIYADGRIYFLSEEGESIVIRPGKTFEKLAANQLDGRFMASISVSGGAMFLRSETHLYRIEMTRKP